MTNARHVDYGPLATLIRTWRGDARIEQPLVPRIPRPIVTHTVQILMGALAASLLAVPAYADTNYVPNPGFETCTAVPGAMPAAWTPFGTDDVDCNATMANTGAFGMALTNPPSTTLARAQSDCVVIPPGTFIQAFRFAYRTASSAVVQVALSANAYTGTDCTGGNGTVSAGAGFSFLEPIATDGNWHMLPTVTALVDGATHSVRFVASFQLNADTLATVDFDDLEFSSASSTTTSTTTTTTTPASTATSTSGAATSTTAVTVTSTTGVTPTTIPLPSFPGTGQPTSECYVTFQGIASGRPECTDGDANCDSDGAADGTCTFNVRVCVAQSLPGCDAGTITTVKAKPAALGIPTPSVPATGPACAAPAQVAVRLRRGGRATGRKTLVFVAKSDGKPKRERDVIRLRCLPTT